MSKSVMSKSGGRPKPASLKTYLGALAATLVVAVIGGFVAGMAAGLGLNSAVAFALGAAIVLGLIFVICIWWWNRLDEAAREAHKWAWWWGGTAGSAIGGVFLVAAVALGRSGHSMMPAGTSIEDAIYAGGMGILLCQVVGYGVGWAAWWLQRR